jgi:hypothetical protein
VRARFTQNYGNEAILVSRPTTIVQTCTRCSDRLAVISSRSQQIALAWQKTRNSERIRRSLTAQAHLLSRAWSQLTDAPQGIEQSAGGVNLEHGKPADSQPISRGA